MFLQMPAMSCRIITPFNNLPDFSQLGSCSDSLESYAAVDCSATSNQDELTPQKAKQRKKSRVKNRSVSESKDTVPPSGGSRQRNESVSSVASIDWWDGEDKIVSGISPQV